MRTAAVLLLLMIPFSQSNADLVTSTSVLTDDFTVDLIGAKSLRFEGTNEFDFSGDGVADQQLNFSLVVESADGQPLVPVFDDGFQTGDLEMDSQLSPLLITYVVEGMTQLPGADSNFNYTFVSADFLGIEVALGDESALLYADQMTSTYYNDASAPWFLMEKHKHRAASDIEMESEYFLKASPEKGAMVLHSMRHSSFTVDVNAVPEPGVAGVWFALVILLMKRRHDRAPVAQRNSVAMTSGV